MTSFFRWSLSVLALVVIAGNVCGAEPEAESLDGRWNVTRLVIGGTELPVRTSPTPFFFQIDGQLWRYTFEVSGKEVTAEFRVTLDTTVSPVAVDAVQLGGSNEGKTLRGICRQNGETLTLYLPENPTISRPTKFEPKPGVWLHLFELQRLPGRDEAGQ
ncbi:TIGR03067 domain-containing protein [Blastopirellula sp. JC732]|uniref:TIGR03067 domain-containing protein n=1 Tax=Blastopirellula sediminis TaxID=2894196 RepID=A0A9X1SHK2_9BACT|nr:TIGR03067 domain-containing protein [Blastopirellula sediminis]MCC9605415.1 TIGR03067 domain-containing protein [Blastopirellula sediminis]MCC9631285.1 TIGR03067 domain-containing protein [Blastopirellula sediminis]